MRSRRPQASSTADARRQARCRQRASSTNSFRSLRSVCCPVSKRYGIGSGRSAFAFGGLHRVTSATMCAISSPPPHSISKRTMRRPTRRPFRGRLIRLGEAERSSTPRRCAGVVATACTQGKRTKHGKPQSVVSEDQPEAREGQAGRLGVAERFVVPRKPGNAGGGKGPQFKTDAIRGEGPGDWETYQLRRVFKKLQTALHAKAKA